MLGLAVQEPGPQTAGEPEEAITTLEEEVPSWVGARPAAGSD
jgi:hypothetical protein